LAVDHNLWRMKVNYFHKLNVTDGNYKLYEREKNFYKDFTEPTEDSCLNLWEAVLNYAMHESFTRADKEIFEKRANVWFEDQREDFTMVCTLIGYDPDYIKEIYVNKLKARVGVPKYGKKRKAS
jgi:hypothetical protein